jgi:predicted MFS family arabinose efflux permease
MAIHRAGKLGRAHNLSKNRAFWLVAYTLFILLVGATIPTPLYPIYQDLFGFSAGVLTVVFAVYMITALFSLIFVGPLSDRVGRRRVLLPALGLAAMGSAVFLFAQDVGWLLAARVLQGLGVGAALGTAVVTLTEFEPTGDHRRAARVGATAAVVGLATGPLASGVFAEYGPWPTVLVFVVYLGLLVPALLGVWAIPETVKEATLRRASSPSQYLSVPQGIRRPFGLAAVAAFGAFSVVAVYMSLGPSVAETLLRVDSRMAAGLVVFALLGTSAVGQLGFRGWPIRRAVVVGPVLLAAGLALIVIALLQESVPLFVVGTLVSGLGHGLAFLGSQQLVDWVAPESSRGAIFSTFYVFIYLGAALPALGVGFGADIVGFLAAVVIFAIVIGTLDLGVGIGGVRARLPGAACDPGRLQPRCL